MTAPFPDHFSAVARGYADRRPRYPDALFTYLASLPPRRDLVWDCGTGSGQAAVPLARHFRRVVATDASAAQLAAAAAHPRVEYRVAPAEASGLDAAGADLVTVAQALHWFDAAAFYAEVRRVLAPGGVVAVWTYGRPELGDGRVDRLLQTFYDDVVGPYWPAERRHVENGYRELAFPFVEAAPPSFAMRARWTLAELLGYVGTWSAAGRFRAAEGHDPVEVLRRTLGTTWGDAATAYDIRWPLRLRVGV